MVQRIQWRHYTDNSIPFFCKSVVLSFFKIWLLISESLWHWPESIVTMSAQGTAQYNEFNTLRLRQNGRLLADDTFKRIFLNENDRIFIKISLKFVTRGPIDNIPTLVQIMAWRWPGDNPLSEPMMVRSPTHICVTRPQWVKSCTFKLLPHLPGVWVNMLLIYWTHYNGRYGTDCIMSWEMAIPN